MEIRNIQRTGDMHYVYLPTSWCKEHHISSQSKVSIDFNSDGSMTVSPQIIEKKPKHLRFNISEYEPEVIHRLVVASYINPVASFEINMDKEMDFTKLLDQKRLLSLESVEIDKKQISCDGTVSIADPSSLLKTMVRKIKNMIIVMCKNYEKNLIERYEDEIDRSKMLIDKAVIGTLTFGKTTKINNIELYYISLISKELEGMVDSLIFLGESDKKFLDEVSEPIEILQNILQDILKLDQKHAMQFAKVVASIKKPDVKDFKSNNMVRIRQNLIAISEVLMDWMVTLKIENKLNY
jgi:antitoxin component of MazEF toxin-antitoxin module|tara:strand:+ start:3101 stop:3985 length:885 start_codon:yes stop_codon:yes gene_type:complete